MHNNRFNFSAPESEFSFSNQWINTDNLAIMNGKEIKNTLTEATYKILKEKFIFSGDYICCKRTDDEEFLCNLYNPFKYYAETLSPDVVSNILGKTQQDFYIHTLFASLDVNNNKQILAWCKHFGYAHYDCSAGGVFNDLKYEYHDNIYVLGPLFKIKADIEVFKLIVKLVELLKAPENIITDIIESLIDEDTFYLLTFDSRSGIDDLTYRRFLTFAGLKRTCKPVINSIINGTISAHIKGITPCITNYGEGESVGDNKWDFVWEFDSLLAALYFMLSLDISTKKTPKLCENPLCGHFFTPSRESAKYCSIECQNRTRQQRHRAKIKKQKEQA